jgi:putative ABC transport system permease protein
LTFKSRNFEIGILLSTGEKKIKIAAQMAVEILIPILIAFSISAALGNISTRQVAGVLSNIQNSVVDEY